MKLFGAYPPVDERLPTAMPKRRQVAVIPSMAATKPGIGTGNAMVRDGVINNEKKQKGQSNVALGPRNCDIASTWCREMTKEP